MSVESDLPSSQIAVDDLADAYVVPSVDETMLDSIQLSSFLPDGHKLPLETQISAPLAIGAAAGTRMVYQYPIRFTGKEKQTSVIRYWAERGLIHASWFDDAMQVEQYEAFTVRTILERLQAVNDMVKNSRASDPNYLPGEMDKLQRYVEEMLELVRIAREQGTPDAPDKGKSLRAATKSRILVP